MHGNGEVCALLHFPQELGPRSPVDGAPVSPREGISLRTSKNYQDGVNAAQKLIQEAIDRSHKVAAGEEETATLEQSAEISGSGVTGEATEPIQQANSQEAPRTLIQFLTPLGLEGHVGLLNKQVCMSYI